MPSRTDIRKILGLDLNSCVDFSEGLLGVCGVDVRIFKLPIQCVLGVVLTETIPEMSVRESARMVEISMPKTLVTSWFLM